MDVQKILTDAAAKVGPSGQEMEVAEYFAEQFRPFVDEVTVDSMFNVIAHKKGTGPKVALFAHMDEIGLMVVAIEEDGSLRLGNVGGVDPRILPACRVWVHGKEKLFGTIGALPPHLMKAEDQKQNYRREDLYVDVGLPAEKVRELVRVGDIVTFNVPSTPLLNGQFSAKTMDDRACVTMLVETAERLRKLQCDADVYFVGSTQEEVGLRGAKTAAWSIDPDYGIAVDVTSEDGIPGAKHTASSLAGQGAAVKVMDRSVICHPEMVNLLMELAQKQGIPAQRDVIQAGGTDAGAIHQTRSGVCTGGISIPCRYTHTPCEMVCAADVEACVELVTALAQTKLEKEC